MKQLNFIGLPQIAIAEGASTPDPGILGVMVWSTTITKVVVWNGSIWSSDQSLLVSGTSIKTINGTSILGSGDLAISGGGGASPILTWAI